jgi:hypothetical protein
MVREILDRCHKAKPQMGILNKSETNPTIQQGQELEINSHTLSVFVKLKGLFTLSEQPTVKSYKTQPIPVPLIFKIHFPIKIPSKIKFLNLPLSF